MRMDCWRNNSFLFDCWILWVNFEFPSSYWYNFWDK